MQDPAREHVVAARPRHHRRQRREDQRQQDAEQPGDDRRPAVGRERPQPPDGDVGERVEDRIQRQPDADECRDVEEQRIRDADVADQPRGLAHEQLWRRARSSGRRFSGRLGHGLPPVLRRNCSEGGAKRTTRRFGRNGLHIAVLFAIQYSRSCRQHARRATGYSSPQRRSVSAASASADREAPCWPARAAPARSRAAGSRSCPRRSCRAWRRGTTSRPGSP